MENNEKIVIAATAVIALGSAAVFAIKRVRNKNQPMMDENVDATTEDTTAPDLR